MSRTFSLELFDLFLNSYSRETGDMERKLKAAAFRLTGTSITGGLITTKRQIVNAKWPASLRSVDTRPGVTG